MEVIYILLGLVLVWLIALTVYLIYLFRFLRRFLGQDTKDVLSLLKALIEEKNKHKENINELYKEVKTLNDQGRNHIQKVSFIRFNPFQELGGDHSFVFTLLDAYDNGILMTGLHSRERTRLYVKEIKKGKSEIELSKEEKKALGLAQTND